MHELATGRLRLVDRVGAGGSGTVWRAWDVRDRTYVAAKLIPLEDAAAAERLRVEHPHVLTPYEWLDFDSRSVCLMPLVRGGTADRLLADHGALLPAYVVALLDQLLDALSALHATGFAHRDVKPANLLLEPTGTGRPHLWLADLGVATRLGEVATTFAGTDGYLAPEVRPESLAAVGHDLYAAGITAAELLTGLVPRHDRDLPRGPLRPLLRDLTAPDPAHRSETADEARARLSAIGGPWRGSLSAPDVPDRMRRLSLRERWRVQGTRAAQ